jgi:hypothetical protein
MVSHRKAKRDLHKTGEHIYSGCPGLDSRNHKEWRALLEDMSDNHPNHIIQLLLRMPVPVLRSLILGTIVHDYASGNQDVRYAVEEAGGLLGI